MTRIHLGIIGSILSLLYLLNAVNGAAVMSIDLGSEWMKVGIVSPGVPMEIALNKESKRKTPTVLAFRDGERIFGEDAETIGVRFPAQSYAYFLDLLGKTIDSPIVELFKSRFPYYNIEADPVRNTVIFRNGDEVFSVEELVAQFLYKARDFAEEATGFPITECVLIVPGFFGQAERSAMLVAANLANIKVLQLINDYTAVALNYGIFRRKEINETAQYFMFYDMGAYKTTASVISYQLVKDKQTREINPVVQVLGVGYDRTLGGLEMQLRLRDYLAKEFNKLKKTPTDIFTNARALAKLFKEAGRVKNILSANTDIYAQVEGLLDDKDFKMHVTRDIFESLCTDLFDRVSKPLDDALKLSGLSLDVISQVTLFGGGTRVPKIQEILKKQINTELGKNLNADEAAVMGASYRAADLATGFKVKKFVTKDAVLFPIQIIFEREGGSESGDSKKQIKRQLFNLMNSYPQKKVITFNKNNEDFQFNVNYGELDHLQQNEINNLGRLNLTQISLTQIKDILDSNKGENVESKGIKAHFTLDDSGIFSLSGVELVFEKTVLKKDSDAEEEESPLSKLGSTISKLFSSDSDDKKKEEEVVKEEIDEKQQQSDDGKTGNDTKTGDKNATLETEEGAAARNETEKPKIVLIKEPIPSEVKVIYSVELDGDRLEESRQKLSVLNSADKARARRETALNALESFVIEAGERLDNKEYASCATAEEIEKIRVACAEVSEWLYEDGEFADAVTYEVKLNKLVGLTNDVYSRHWEHSERLDALKALEGMINGSKGFLVTAKNLTKDTNPEKDVFTQVEIDTLQRVIKETIEWRDVEVKEQKKLARNAPVRLTVKALADKMALLDREVKYLVNKIKIWKPRVKDGEKKKESSKKKGTKDAKKEDGDEKEDEPVEGFEEILIGEPNVDENVVDAEEAMEEEIVNVPELPSPTETEKDEDDTKHSEL